MDQIALALYKGLPLFCCFDLDTKHFSDGFCRCSTAYGTGIGLRLTGEDRMRQCIAPGISAAAAVISRQALSDILFFFIYRDGEEFSGNAQEERRSPVL